MKNQFNKGVDVAVALFFFNRPEPLRKVFEVLRLVKPSKLFLVQDGARNFNITDNEKIKACREIVENVDWDCDVFRDYSDSNLSCDHRVFTGISWAFQYVESLVILEDDCVPSLSFFPFCAEILTKYKDDSRIHMISGMNYLDEFNGTQDSYFFSKVASGWGWATWKRTWVTASEQKNFDFLQEDSLKKMVSDNIKHCHLRIPSIKRFIETAVKYREENIRKNKVHSWEYAMGISQILNSSLVITPKKNLISNIGLTEDSTHAVNQLKKLDKRTQKLFFKKSFEIDFPLKHPKYVIRNFDYEKKHRKLVGSNRIVIFMRKVDSVLRRLYFSNSDERIELLSKYIRKIKKY